MRLWPSVRDLSWVAAGRPSQDLLHGVWLGHRVHPVVTDVPLGAWTAALVLDTADMVAPRPHGFRQAAQLSIGLGVLGGIHLGAPTVEGWLYRDELVCPWHGSRFDLQTGAVTTGPATSPLTRFQTRVRRGQIEIRRVPPAQITTGQTSAEEVTGR